jgi:hypothetical protein
MLSGYGKGCVSGAGAAGGGTPIIGSPGGAGSACSFRAHAVLRHVRSSQNTSCRLAMEVSEDWKYDLDACDSREKFLAVSL